MICLGDGERTGSVTVVGAVSPPGGDFSEPITQNTLRVVGTFWALDTNLAYRRHFPSVNWIKSYSLYLDSIAEWYSRTIARDWRELRDKAMYLLQKEVELQEIVQLVGPDALPDSEKAILEVTRMIREDFLQQSAYSDTDSFCPIEKQYLMLKVIMSYYEQVNLAMNRGVSLRQIQALPLRVAIGRMKEAGDLDAIRNLNREIGSTLDGTGGGEMKDSSLLTREYRTIGYVSGPLIFVTGVKGASFGEIVKITLHDGEEAQRAGARYLGRPRGRPGL